MSQLAGGRLQTRASGLTIPRPGPENPGPAAASSESGGPEVAAVVPHGQQKSKQRAEKVERGKKQPRK